MPTLSDTELRMIAEVVTELAQFRGTAFDKIAKGNAFARAALIDPAFRARLPQPNQDTDNIDVGASFSLWPDLGIRRSKQ